MLYPLSVLAWVRLHWNGSKFNILGHLMLGESSPATLLSGAPSDTMFARSTVLTSPLKNCCSEPHAAREGSSSRLVDTHQKHPRVRTMSPLGSDVSQAARALPAARRRPGGGQAEAPPRSIPEKPGDPT